MRQRRDDAKRKPLRKTENNCCDLTMLEFKLKEFLACTTTLVPHVIPAMAKGRVPRLLHREEQKRSVGVGVRKERLEHDTTALYIRSAALQLYYKQQPRMHTVESPMARASTQRKGRYTHLM